MAAFDSSTYGSAIVDLLRLPRTMALVPGVCNEPALSALEQLSNRDVLAPHTVVDPHMADACRAALWLYHGYLDRSHTISQGIASETGSYWHGIMHRREPDYPNSKYWFRQVGDHPVHADLFSVSAELAAALPEVPAGMEYLVSQESWDPFAFVDSCESAAGSSGAASDLCVQIQMREWELLFDFCYRAAAG